jgi:hypothetical protein
MDEKKWLACTDPHVMWGPLLHLVSRPHDEIRRKGRLLVCALCRRHWHLLTDYRSRQAVEVAERFADDQASADELRAGLERASRAIVHDYSAGQELRYDQARAPRRAACSAACMAQCAVTDQWLDAVHVTGYATQAAVQAAYAVQGGALVYREREQFIGISSIDDDEDFLTMREPYWPGETVIANMEDQVLVSLQRDIFGNPFRPVPVDGGWLHWNNGCIPKIAGSIYEERAFDQLPVLADALEDAGCTNQDLLDHCRQPGEHVRGCWVVDLIIGKQ